MDRAAAAEPVELLRAYADGLPTAGEPLSISNDKLRFGFAILNRLRSRFPHARSILMDRKTLLAHQSQWVTEKTPTKAALVLLTPAEQDLYQDLVEGTFGPAVRLEQERVSFASLEYVLPLA